jgi:prepilin-type N-terminal cleavage/methylation domain-containing protein
MTVMRRRQRGFSLVEVLAALLIVTFVITVSMAAFVERNRRLQQATEITLAYQALANEAEYRRRQVYIGLRNDVAFRSDTTLLRPLRPFGTAVRVDDVKPGVKKVTMILRWRNGQRHAQLTLVRVDTGGTNLW